MMSLSNSMQLDFSMEQKMKTKKVKEKMVCLESAAGASTARGRHGFAAQTRLRRKRVADERGVGRGCVYSGDQSAIISQAERKGLIDAELYGGDCRAIEDVEKQTIEFKVKRRGRLCLLASSCQCPMWEGARKPAPFRLELQQQRFVSPPNTHGQKDKNTKGRGIFLA